MKKSFLFGLMALMLAGFGFGGISMATDVARIGETSYTSLSDAIENSNGQTVVLVNDVVLTAGLSIEGKTMVLDLNGHSISKAGGTVIYITTGSNVTITGNGFVGIADHDNDGTAIWVNNGGKAIINNGGYQGGTVAYVYGTGSEMIINAGIFTGTKAGNRAEIHATVRGLITINGGTFTAEPSSSGKPQKVIYAGADDNKCGAADQNYNVEGGTVEINGGYFEGRLSRSNGGTYNILGGTFNIYQDKTAGVGCDYTVCDKGTEDPSSCKNIAGMAAMLNPGYIAVPTGEDGVYTVQAGQTVAVTFSTNGKTANTVVYIKNGDTISRPNPDTKFSSSENGIFDWYVENEVFDFTTPITSDITLYGEWKHTVSFDKNGGLGTIADQEIRDGQQVEKPANPTKNGEVFAGWFNGDDAFDFGVALTNTDPLAITLTGRWEAMISAGTAEIEQEDGTQTGMVVEANAPATPTVGAAQVQASNSTATIQGEVELDVYNDADGNLVKDDTTPIPTKVNFTSPVLVRIPVNTTGNVVVRVKHNGDTSFTYEGLTTSSTATCFSGAATPAYNGEGIAPKSGYVEIYTCSASTFVAYTETANPVVQGGGGGGSSSSYSCKSLPANAVANNTTKPKTNTYYSYSTDTGAVCTFQCKDGYAWNEKDSKCEKADETVANVNTTEETTDADTTAAEDLQKVLDDGYNVEFHKAYEFAFQNGITTMPTIEEADMNGNLNRIAMAKMLSQYAINILGKTPDTTREVPNFPDVDAQLDADYNNGVTLAYQLGIMGINIDEFRPFDLVTRAEFGTALSRMLFGLADGEGDAYYSTHLEKLMSEGIITNDNPRLDELRGYVMIMLMRSANK